MLYGRTSKKTLFLTDIATPGPGSYILPSDFGVLDPNRTKIQQIPRIGTQQNGGRPRLFQRLNMSEMQQRDDNTDFDTQRSNNRSAQMHRPKFMT
jgi:hypothetical protein